jgi:hypothetical protein
MHKSLAVLLMLVLIATLSFAHISCQRYVITISNATYITATSGDVIITHPMCALFIVNCQLQFYIGYNRPRLCYLPTSYHDSVGVL